MNARSVFLADLCACMFVVTGFMASSRKPTNFYSHNPTFAGLDGESTLFAAH